MKSLYKIRINYFVLAYKLLSVRGGDENASLPSHLQKANVTAPYVSEWMSDRISKIIMLCILIYVWIPEGCWMSEYIVFFAEIQSQDMIIMPGNTIKVHSVGEPENKRMKFPPWLPELRLKPWNMFYKYVPKKRKLVKFATSSCCQLNDVNSKFIKIIPHSCF